MKPTEVVALVRAIAAMCPAQKLDEYTADAWHPLLEDIRMEDARLALVKLGRQQEFIAPCHIVIEVKAMRTKRIEENDLPQPPSGLSEPEYRSWLRAKRTAIADGELVTGLMPEIKANTDPADNVKELVAGSAVRMVADVPVVKGECIA